MTPMSMDEAACAGCGKPLGPRANWHVPSGHGGRAYHKDCEPPEPEPEEAFIPTGKTLTEHAERAARNVLHGRGQRTLEEDSRE